jgi:hypothetical protein
MSGSEGEVEGVTPQSTLTAMVKSLFVPTAGISTTLIFKLRETSEKKQSKTIS